MKLFKQTYGRLPNGIVISKNYHVDLPKLLLVVFLVTGIVRLTWKIGKNKKD